jgi:hypothetical protein
MCLIILLTKKVCSLKNFCSDEAHTPEHYDLVAVCADLNVKRRKLGFQGLFSLD